MAAAPEALDSRVAWLVIIAGVVAALHVGKLPPGIPILRAELGLTLVQAGFLLSVMQVAGMLLGALAGLLADRMGLRRTMLLGLACRPWVARWVPRHPVCRGCWPRAWSRG